MAYDPNTKYIITRHQLNMLLHDCAHDTGSIHDALKYKEDYENLEECIKKYTTRLNERLDHFYETIKKQPLDEETTS